MNSYKRPEHVKQFNQEDKQPNLYNIDHTILSDKQSLIVYRFIRNVRYVIPYRFIYDVNKEY